MKKIFTLSIFLFIITMTVSAQRGLRSYQAGPADLNVYERIQLQRDMFRFRIVQSLAGRDGRITLTERKRLQKIRRKTRRDAIRLRLNRRHSVI